MINTPDFNVPPDRHIVTKHLNKVFPAGSVLKEPAAAIPAMVIFTIMGQYVVKKPLDDDQFFRQKLWRAVDFASVNRSPFFHNFRRTDKNYIKIIEKITQKKLLTERVLGTCRVGTFNGGLGSPLGS